MRLSNYSDSSDEESAEEDNLLGIPKNNKQFHPNNTLQIRINPTV